MVGTTGEQFSRGSLAGKAQERDHVLRHRFPLFMYPSTMAVIAAAPIALRVPGTSPYPVSLEILLVVALLAALAAAGYYIGRRYVSSRLNRRD